MADSSAPLLHRSRPRHGCAERIAHWRGCAQSCLASKQKHYVILGLVGLDVVAILAEILVSLVTCEEGTQAQDVPWAGAMLETTKWTGLVISSLFLVELLSSIWAFGWGFFTTWFHCFDAFVILVSFIVDVLAHGVLKDIASLVVILRLWRMVKIVEEMSVGAEEQMEELAMRITKLEREKDALEQQLRALEETQDATA